MRWYASAALWLLFAVPSRAGGAGGVAPLDFLFLDADARPVAMGGAHAALATDANALLYNPAGLAFLGDNHASFMHAEHFQGASQEYAALAMRGPLAGLPPSAGAAVMMNTVGYGNIQRTTVSNPRGTGLGSFGIRDWELAGGYGARTRWSWLGMGVGFKYLREEIDRYSAQAVAVDLGLRADLAGVWDVPAALGLALQNVGTKLRFQSEREDLPLNLKAGLAYRFLRSGALALDVNQPRNGDATLHLGVEYVALSGAALRLGYNGRNEADSGITLGGGLRLRSFGVDYAFVPYGGLGSSHRISLAYHW